MRTGLDRTCEICGRHRDYWTRESRAFAWAVCGRVCRRRMLREQRRQEALRRRPQIELPFTPHPTG